MGPTVRWGQAPRVGICPPLWVGQPPAAPRSFRQLPVQTGSQRLAMRAAGWPLAGRWGNGQLDACAWEPGPTSTTEELCGCLGRGSTGPSSRRAGRGPGHKTRVAAPAGEPGASHKGRLGGRLRQQWQSRRAVGDGKLCRAGQELRRNVRAVHEQHSQLFRALAQFSSSGNAVSSSSAAPARAYPPPAPLSHHA